MRLITRTVSGRDTVRLEAFSDAVIAIAITLLVLEIQVPHVEHGGELWSALGGLWPSYIGYLLSFIMIGIMWANHHNIFKHIERADHYLVLINLLLLLTIGFFPFTTALLAEYLGKEGERTAVIVYSGSFFLSACDYNLLWFYASWRGRLLAPDTDPAIASKISKSYRLGPPTSLLAFGLAFVFPPASLMLLGLLALL